MLIDPNLTFQPNLQKKKKKRAQRAEGAGAAREGGPFWNRTGSSSGCCHGFLFVGTNCRPVAESLSCCLLKISGKAGGGGERKRETDRYTEGALLRFFFFFCLLLLLRFDSRTSS